MKYREERRDLFSVDSEYHLAHCISADFAMGKGIAVEFDKKFNLKSKLKKSHPNYLIIWTQIGGDCIKEDKVFNLITKGRFYEKPTLNNLKNSLKKMKSICLEENILKVAMPKIGCGLDRLNWKDVKQLLFETFQDTDIEIFVCYM